MSGLAMSDLALSPSTPVTLAIGNPSQSAPAGSSSASLTVWISVFAAMIGAFMAILNIQITNASLLPVPGWSENGLRIGPPRWATP